METTTGAHERSSENERVQNHSSSSTTSLPPLTPSRRTSVEPSSKRKPSTPSTPSHQISGAVSNNNSSSNTHTSLPRLNALQIATVLKSFWINLLQNDLKKVRKTVADNHLRMDFNAARYAPNADGTAMHLCAQYGFVEIAEMLLDFGLDLNARNKVGQTPLHLACKFAQIPMVEWLLRQRVRLDIPDQQNRVAFDVAASYEVLDTCVLAPLRQELAAHESVNADRVMSLEAACAELDASQLAFRRVAMTLTDLESQLEEERQRVLARSAREQAWRERERRLMGELDEMNACLDAEKARWQQENDALQTEFDAHMRPAQHHHEELVSKRNTMTRLVADTEDSLRRHEHRLQHQLGVVDAANVSFPDNRDVQLWSWSLLCAMLARIEQDEHGDLVQSDMLVLFDQATIDGVQRTLAAFSRDVELVSTALEVMVRLFRVFVNSAGLCDSVSYDAMEPFASRARDGSVLGALADVMSQWQNENAASQVLNLAFEAMFFALKCTRTSHQRVLRICQSRVIHVLCLRMLSEIGMSEEIPVERRWLTAHVSLVLYTLVKYGIKTPLVQRGVLGLVMALAQGLLNGADTTNTVYPATIEALEHAFAALALVLAPRRPTTSTDVQIDQLPTAKRELQLNDFHDVDALDVELVLAVMQFASSDDSHTCRRESTSCVYWSMRLLHHASQHIGAHAARVRSSLLSPTTAMTVVLDAVTFGCQRHEASDCVRVIDAGIDLLQAVWLERFDDEGRLLPTETAVLFGLVDVAVFQVNCLSSRDSVSALHLSDLVRVWQPLAIACGNATNVKVLSALAMVTDDSASSLATAVSVALRWVVQYVDETSARYREPQLVSLLRSVLALWLPICELHVQTNGATVRVMHTMCRTIGVCAILHALETATHNDDGTRSAMPRDWCTLAALCHRLRLLLDCKC